ncbi:AI-2E family transporter [Vulcaniibacterium tengchongense]|uniref:Putative PurR-regulated permease PerM n=1 Tax=Vulcaniibacterium tengchongense TaxID=1273429 RepID=A0A3N4W120_9GAMM|nr:AI-2E family transporter [Vulcaniibacterium tengchongense]RPE79730.1 putative PurR-regulated permease PerM [Vulcaniibacterium tengchongense]
MTPDPAPPRSDSGDDGSEPAQQPAPRPRASAAALTLATLAVGFALWAAQDLILPVLLAMFFALVGNPILRGLQRLRLPRMLGAALLIAGGLAGAVALGNQLIEPAGEWVRQVPREMRQLAPKLRAMTKPMQDAAGAAQNIARVAGGETRTVQVVRTEANDPYRSLTATPRRLASVLAVVLLTFFFMVYGQSLQRNAIALLPTRQQQKLTVDILQSIEREISRYVLTISLINLGVGLALTGALYALDVPLQEALLWGTMAAILNFAPYVGPLIGIVIMLLMGFVAFDALWPSLLPAGIYLLLHTVESQLITPIVLGRRMRLSPLVLILALMLFGWLWGIIGLLLAVPLLVCVKLVLARISGLEGWARLLE